MAGRVLDVVRTGTFRFSAIAACLSAATTLLLFAFIYWQTAGYETRRLEDFLLHEQAALTARATGDILQAVNRRYAADLHRATFAAVLAADGRVLAGDVRLPPGLPVDGAPHWTYVARRTDAGDVREPALAVARQLPGGGVLLVGRSADELRTLRSEVLRALLIGLVPGMLLAMVVGAMLGRRSLARIRAMNAAIGRIVEGNFAERLPVRGAPDALDQLAGAVNRMLGEIERLIGEIAGVGDDIAHDLRTPLTRVRARLEGGLRRSDSREALAETVEAAIGDLDQSFQTITALLRISEISGAQRRANFAEVSLAPLLREVADLYQPIAEQNEIALHLQVDSVCTTFGDRDLLFEAVANLVDNAIKFAPPRSTVRLTLAPDPSGPVLGIIDAGPGIAESEREAVVRRFYRGDRSRRGAGHGLGLSIVSAILRLHGFNLELSDARPGLAVSIVCRADARAAESG